MHRLDRLAIDKKVATKEYKEYVAKCDNKVKKIIPLYKLIDFKTACDFQNGVCVGARAARNDSISCFEKPSLSLTKYGCCCSYCYSSEGHFNGRKIYKNKLDKLKQYWTPKTGFLQKGEGCRLPIEMRSITCLTFICDIARKNMSVKDRKLLRNIERIRF